jgi:hypothetical protein
MADPFDRPEVRDLVNQAIFEKFGADFLRDGLLARGVPRSEVDAVIANLERESAEERGES